MPKKSLEEHHSSFGKIASETFQWIMNIALLVTGALLSYSLFAGNLFTL